MRTLSVFLLAIALALSSGHAADDKTGGHDHHAMAFETCAKACGDCQRECDSCAHHCAHLVAQGKKDHLKSLQTCQDCATHCSAAACITARQGPFSDLICKACAEACDRCGATCEKFPDDEHMKKCAQECRKCEKACKEMLQHTGRPGATSTNTPSR